MAGCGGGSSSSSSTATEATEEPAETSEETGAEGGEEEDGETTNAALENANYLSEGETGGGIRPEGGAEQKKAEEAGTKAGGEVKPA